MAVLFTTVKNTNQEVIIHFDTVAAETGTIALNTLGAATQTLTPGGTPTVNIVKFFSTGELGAGLRITRNSGAKNIIACAPENAPFLDLNSNGFSDTTYNTTDIQVTNDVAKPVTGYLVLRKVSGWDTNVETAWYGAYDDPTVVGASSTLSGSPGAPGATPIG
jgi:hypothetical protein